MQRTVLFLAFCFFSFSAAAQGWSNPGGFYEPEQPAAQQPQKPAGQQSVPGCVNATYESYKGIVQHICSRDGRHKRIVNGKVVATWNGSGWVYTHDEVISRDEFADDDYGVNAAAEVQ